MEGFLNVSVQYAEWLDENNAIFVHPRTDSAAGEVCIKPRLIKNLSERLFHMVCSKLNLPGANHFLTFLTLMEDDFVIPLFSLAPLFPVKTRVETHNRSFCVIDLQVSRCTRRRNPKRLRNKELPSVVQ